MKCREAQKEFTAVGRSRRQDAGFSDQLAEQVERHLAECGACAGEFRLYTLQQTVLGLAGANRTQKPDADWFAVVKARIARQADVEPISGEAEDSWTGLVWITAKHLIPIMTAVMVIILGVSLFWRTSTPPQDSGRATDRFLFSPQVYEYPQPTADDVIDTLVAVEDRNGR